ncbi:25138_t:CDS:1, partial [Racocetra persica]
HVEESSRDYLMLQSVNPVVEESDCLSSIGPLGDKSFEFTKLQEELASISAEWKEKNSQDIHSLRIMLRQAIQIERTRATRVNIIVSNTASNNILEVF